MPIVLTTIVVVVVVMVVVVVVVDAGQEFDRLRPGNNASWSASRATRSINRARNHTCVSVASRTNESSSSSPRAWSDSITLCGSGATLKQIGIPISAATLAPASVPASAIRRCSTSIGPGETQRTPDATLDRRQMLPHLIGGVAGPCVIAERDRAVRQRDSARRQRSDDGVGDRAAPDREHMIDVGSARQCLTERDQQTGDATGVAATAETELTVEASGQTSWAIRRPCGSDSIGAWWVACDRSGRSAASVPTVSSNAASWCSTSSMRSPPIRRAQRSPLHEP